MGKVRDVDATRGEFPFCNNTMYGKDEHGGGGGKDAREIGIRLESRK